MSKTARLVGCLAWTVVATTAVTANGAAPGPATAPASSRARADVDRAVRAADQPRDPAALARLRRQLVRRHGPNALGPLIEARGGGSSPAAAWFASQTIIELLDPCNDLGLRALAGGSGPIHDLVLAALSVSDEPAARDELLRSAAAGSACASGLLRSGDPRKIRPRIEAILRDDPLGSMSRLHLWATLDSFYYADTLTDPGDRAAYRAYERAMWWGFAVARKGTTSSTLPYSSAAERVLRVLGPVDDRFVLRTGTDSASTPEDRRVAAYLVTAAPRSVWFHQEVERATAAGSPQAQAWAKGAVRALKWHEAQNSAAGKGKTQAEELPGGGTAPQ